jgi:hypothetical protein
MDTLLTRVDAAVYLQSRGFKIAPATLAKLAVTGDGPPFVKFLSRALYQARDLDCWADGRMSPKRQSTAGCRG